MFFKKLKTLVVPAEHALKVCELHDAIYSGPGLNQSQVGRYHFWTFIEELFPETKKGKWQMIFNKAQSPKIREFR